MSTATISMRRNQNITRQKTRFQTGPVTVGLMLTALVILLALLYLNQITKTSVYNYKISNLTAKQIQLETEKQKLQIEAARLQSLEQLKASAQANGLVKTDIVSFAK